MKIDLRKYQSDAIEQARQAIRGGAKNVLICAPTGGGKTVIASALIEANQGKGKRSAFVVDRLSLIQQTSDTFDRYGIDHGIIQADHPRFRPSKPVQLCSQQTVARRRWPDADLIVVDEAHTVTETVKKRISPRDTITIGLTATPFTKGLGKLYDAVVNVTTTNVQQAHLQVLVELQQRRDQALKTIEAEDAIEGGLCIISPHDGHKHRLPCRSVHAHVPSQAVKLGIRDRHGRGGGSIRVCGPAIPKDPVLTAEPDGL